MVTKKEQKEFSRKSIMLFLFQTQIKILRCMTSNAKLMQKGIFFLIDLFAGDVLVMKKLGIKKN